MQLYWQWRMVVASHGRRRATTCKVLAALDLRTLKPDDTLWNFANAAGQAVARQMIDGEAPDWLIGSPPCTARCSWNVRMHYRKVPKQNADTMLQKGRRHLI